MSLVQLKEEISAHFAIHAAWSMSSKLSKMEPLLPPGRLTWKRTHPHIGCGQEENTSTPVGLSSPVIVTSVAAVDLSPGTAVALSLAIAQV